MNALAVSPQWRWGGTAVLQISWTEYIQVALIHVSDLYTSRSFCALSSQRLLCVVDRPWCCASLTPTATIILAPLPKKTTLSELYLRDIWSRILRNAELNEPPSASTTQKHTRDVFFLCCTFTSSPRCVHRYCYLQLSQRPAVYT